MSHIQTYVNNNFSVTESKITLNFQIMSLKYQFDLGSYVVKVLSSVILVL